VTSKVEYASLARAGIVLALAGAGGVVGANAGIALVVYISYATVGTILIIKRSGKAIGLLLTAVGWEFALGFLPLQATVDGLQTLTAPPIVLAVPGSSRRGVWQSAARTPPLRPTTVGVWIRKTVPSPPAH
jgi:hypothetical protein